MLGGAWGGKKRHALATSRRAEKSRGARARIPQVQTSIECPEKKSNRVVRKAAVGGNGGRDPKSGGGARKKFTAGKVVDRGQRSEKRGKKMTAIGINRRLHSQVRGEKNRVNEKRRFVRLLGMKPSE